MQRTCAETVRPAAGIPIPLLFDKPSGSPAAMARHLDELYGTLSEEFARLEASDLYTVLPEEFPEYAHKIERLRAEHDRILRCLSRLRDALQHGRISTEEAMTSTRRLLRDVRKKEERESDILYLVYAVDTPALD